MRRRAKQILKALRLIGINKREAEFLGIGNNASYYYYRRIPN